METTEREDIGLPALRIRKDIGTVNNTYQASAAKLKKTYPET